MSEKVLSHSPVKLIDEVISHAFRERASDIHIEPSEHECRIRIRVDGRLIRLGNYHKKIHEEAVARLKVLSSLRTDVRTSPQDGRFKAHIADFQLNIRLSIIPSFFGEKCVLRLLHQTSQVRTLEELGFNIVGVNKIFDSIKPFTGLVLVVGPTGSGKTTTLYSILNKISAPEISTVTLEDPIEYSFPNITQIPVHVAANLNFSTALRSVLRQDPDVIMVGEIRDTQTAELSIHSALTGHLLLSTLHTNDAITALPRLIDMGVEPFLIASTVRTIISQRLIRKICEKCKTERKITVSEIDYLKKEGLPEKVIPQTVSYGRGCGNCQNSGYLGRTVIAEILVLTDKIRNLLMQKVDVREIEKVACEEGMIGLKKDAIRKVLEGTATIEEVSSL